MLKITGYSDEISVRPGETVSFMVSCDLPDYEADIVRLVCGDTNPEGPGYKEDLIESSVSGRYEGRRQEIHAGSYAIVPSSTVLGRLESFSVQAMIWPTTPAKDGQGLVAKWNEEEESGFALIVDEDGSVALRLGDGNGGVEVVSAGKSLVERKWYFVGASYDARSGRVSVHQGSLVAHAGVDDAGSAIRDIARASRPTTAPWPWRSGSCGKAGAGRSPTATTTARSTAPGSRTALLRVPRWSSSGWSPSPTA